LYPNISQYNHTNKVGILLSLTISLTWRIVIGPLYNLLDPRAQELAGPKYTFLSGQRLVFEKVRVEKIFKTLFSREKEKTLTSQ